MDLTLCKDCGAEWGWYTDREQSHYCLGGRRVFRKAPTEQELERDQARRRDPLEVESDNYELMEAYNRSHRS
jgi:hypothetical protein